MAIEDEKLLTVEESHESHLIQLVTFYLGEEEYAVDILIVNEIIRLMQITPVPNAPEFLEGVVNLRGKVIPVISLRKRFELEPIEHDSATRIIVMELQQKILGFMVDSVSEVLRMDERIIEEAPPIVSGGINGEYITGVARLEGRLLIILDLEKLLESSPI